MSFKSGVKGKEAVTGDESKGGERNRNALKLYSVSLQYTTFRRCRL